MSSLALAPRREEEEGKQNDDSTNWEEACIKVGIFNKTGARFTLFCTFYCLLKMQIHMHLQIWLGKAWAVLMEFPYCASISLSCCCICLLLSGRRRNHKVFNVERQQKTTTHASLYFSSVSVPAAPLHPRRREEQAIINLKYLEEGRGR